MSGRERDHRRKGIRVEAALKAGTLLAVDLWHQVVLGLCRNWVWVLLMRFQQQQMACHQAVLAILPRNQIRDQFWAYEAACKHLNRRNINSRWHSPNWTPDTATSRLPAPTQLSPRAPNIHKTAAWTRASPSKPTTSQTNHRHHLSSTSQQSSLNQHLKRQFSHTQTKDQPPRKASSYQFCQSIKAISRHHLQTKAKEPIQ